MARTMRDKERESWDWDAMHNQRGWAGTFDPDSHKQLGMSRSKYVDIFYRAFVAGKDTYQMKRGDSYYFFTWMTEVVEEYTVEEYDERYGEE